MPKYLLLFLFFMLFACSVGKGESLTTLIWTQIGSKSFVEISGEIWQLDTLGDGKNFDAYHRFIQKAYDLWVFEAKNVSVWKINGEIPDEFMYLQENNMAILGKNANLPKTLALRFLRIIVLPCFYHENLLWLMQNYGEKIQKAQENFAITFKTDGHSWHF